MRSNTGLSDFVIISADYALGKPRESFSILRSTASHCHNEPMGSIIRLSLNGVAVDSGKNHFWTAHGWLFPPGSQRDVEYLYVNDRRVMKPGLKATLNQVKFRLNHLGYSLPESRDRFNVSLRRWNQTNDLNLSFDEYLEAVTSIDFSSMTAADEVDFEFDIRNLVLQHLETKKSMEWSCEDFVKERLHAHILLRCLAERVDNRDLALTWEFQDLVENGWETQDTLMQVDFDSHTLKHIRLYGRLQDHSKCNTVEDFDKWLEQQGLPKRTPYTQAGPNGPKAPRMKTLPTVVRHMIHHPENRNHVLEERELQVSVEQLLQVCQSSSLDE